jgi:hypothetical protein
VSCRLSACALSVRACPTCHTPRTQVRLAGSQRPASAHRDLSTQVGFHRAVARAAPAHLPCGPSPRIPCLGSVSPVSHASRHGDRLAMVRCGTLQAGGISHANEPPWYATLPSECNAATPPSACCDRAMLLMIPVWATPSSCCGCDHLLTCLHALQCTPRCRRTTSPATRGLHL